jgi:hypothetical protein
MEETQALFRNRLLQMAERIPQLFNDDAAVVPQGRTAQADFLLEIGTTPYYVSVRAGRITGFDRGPAIMRCWSFAIRGPESTWEQFWRPIPPPQFHDIFSLAKRGDFTIEGDLRPLMTHLLFFKALLAAPRRATGSIS